MSEHGDDQEHRPPGWTPPAGPAAPDPDPHDEREDATPGPPPPPGAPAPVTPLAGDAPVVGQPWTVRAHTAAGVSGVAIEIEGRSGTVSLHQDPPPAGAPPTWSGTVDGVGPEPLRYRYVWRSDWAGGVTDWQTVTPQTAPTPDV